ncbi:MAG TPA: pyridoxal phosphate-dependent aminotransferase [Verrucomicrobiae bacterium]|nr:pyridoxal phosphate-dependent aminotransferase [Verrucomicrobiae bacterium]
MQQLAQRATTLTPSLTLAIDAKAKTLKAEGVDVCGFGAGEPDFDTPQHIKDAAAEALADGFTKYTPSSGTPELRAAIAEKLKNDNGLDYKPSQIIVNCGAKHSCYNAVLATCQAGDEVIIPAPYWLSYPEMVKLADASPVIVPTREENGFKITPDQFRDAMTPATKLIIINSPGNPTGSVYTREELLALAEVALEEEILMLSDEIYEKITYDGAQSVSLASLSPEIYDFTVTVNGFSKAYAMTGWRLGYIAAPEPIAAAIDSIQSHSTSNPTSFAQKGAVAGLKGDQSFIGEMVKAFAERRAYIYDRLTKIPGVTCVKPMGAFYMLPNVSAFGLGSTDFCTRLLDQQKVAAVPGIAFGTDAHIRLSYACSMANIQKGLDRIEAFCASLKNG